MNKIFLFLFLSTFNCFGQDISGINKELNLPDSLGFEKEIRIYKDYSNLTGLDIFRMYDNGKNDWTVVIYHYNKEFKSVTKIEEVKFPKENIGNLKPKDAHTIWLNFLLSDIEYLPNLKDIDYKLKNIFNTI